MPLFKKNGLYLAPAFGLLGFVLSLYLNVESLFVLALLGLSIYQLSKFGILNLLKKLNWYHLFPVLFILMLSYFKLLQFWDWGPPGDNQDTLWYIGHIAYYKNNLPFVDVFSDIHLMGLNYNYHFFGHFLFGRMAQMFSLSAVSAGVMANAVSLISTYFLFSQYLKEKINLPKWGLSLATVSPFVFFGLLGIIDPYYTLGLNPTIVYYFNTNLFITLALFLTLAALIIYLELIAETEDKILLSLVFCTIAFLLSCAKTPYAVVVIGACGLHAFYNFIIKMNREHFWPFLATFASLVLFLALYRFYYLEFATEALKMTYGVYMEGFLKYHWPSLALDPLGKILATILYLLLFYGLSCVVHVFSIFHHRSQRFVFNCSFLGFAAILVGSTAFLFLDHRGGSQIYFATAALFISNILTVLSICHRLQQGLVSVREKIFLGTFFCVNTASFYIGAGALNFLKQFNFWFFIVAVFISLAIVVWSFKRQLAFKRTLAIVGIMWSMLLAFDLSLEEGPSYEELNLRRACRWIKENSQVGDKVAVNIFDDPAGGTGSFFSCSALSERQILIEGFSYTTPNEAGLNLVNALKRQNSEIFKKKGSAQVRFILDTKNEISQLAPSLEISETNPPIRVFKTQ